jgi:hypothetical protein
MTLKAVLAALWRHPLGRTGALVLGAWLLLAIFAYTFSADPAPWANTMNLAESAKPMAYTALPTGSEPTATAATSPADSCLAPAYLFPWASSPSESPCSSESPSEPGPATTVAV